MSTILSHMVCLSASLECMSEMCCTRLAENTGRKKNRHFGTIAQLCRAVSSQLTHVSTIGKKNLLNIDTSSTDRQAVSFTNHRSVTSICGALEEHLLTYLLPCAHNMVNFGPLTAETRWRVWGTPANFNGFRVLTVLLHGTLVVGVNQTLWR